MRISCGGCSLTQVRQHDFSGRNEGPHVCDKGKINTGLNRLHHEPVWPSGKALGWSAEGPRFSPLRLSFLLKIGGLWTLFCDFAHTINEMLKRLTQLPTLMQNHSCGESVTSRC